MLLFGLLCACGRTPLDALSPPASDLEEDASVNGEPASDLEEDASLSEPIDASVDLSASRPARPKLRASSDLIDRVHLEIEWETRESERIDRFHLMRDGTLIASLPADARSHDDFDAEPGRPAPPRMLEASQGTLQTGIELRWQASDGDDAEPGAHHEYTVVALADGVPSAPSEPAIGFRLAAPVERYELTRNDGQSWFAETEALSFLDARAPVADVEPGRANAEPLLFPLRSARLYVVGVEANIARTIYRVRAVAGDAVSEPSASVVGHRAMQPLRYRWQRSRGERDRDYEDLPNATGPSWFDADLPMGETRYYRALVGAGDDPEVASEVVRAEGFPAAKQVVQYRSDIHCALFVDNRLYCNSAGNVPTGWVDGEHSWVSTYYTLCSLLTDGRRKCWGSNDFRTAPRGISKTLYSDLSVGGPLCMIRKTDHLLECSGTFNSYERNNYPRDVEVKRVSVGGYRACALLSDDRLQCWGANEYGTFEPTDDRYLAVHADESYAGSHCAVHESGRLHCFSDNRGDRLSSPLGLRFTQVGANLALLEDGRLYSFRTTTASGERVFRGDFFDDGYRYTRIDGHCAVREDGGYRCSNLYTLPLSHTATDLFIGGSQCLVDQHGALHCQNPDWEINGTKLEDFEAKPRSYARHTYDVLIDHEGRAICSESAPAKLGEPCLPEDQRYESATITGSNLCALNESGQIYCTHSYLGPQLDPPPFPDTYVALEGHYWRACAIRTDGSVQCHSFNSSAPLVQEVPESIARVPARAVAVNYEDTCVLGEDERVRCFALEKLPLPEGATFVELVGTYGLFCARTAEGLVTCWNNTTPSGSQTWLGRYDRIAAGEAGICGLRDDGKLICPAHNVASDRKAIVMP